jgi:TonB-dependent SusC/RagA subfamily outer membrane receptor
VDEKAIQNRPMVSAAEALQGKAAGVQVVQPSGKPGADLSVRVRGSTSVLAGNEPLYVVDGVPTTDIRGLNPSDIESMSVLKDASSAAIYGARAANGVVLITTKRGKADQSVVQFSAYGGFSTLRKPLETLSTKKYRDLINEIIRQLRATPTGKTKYLARVSIRVTSYRSPVAQKSPDIWCLSTTWTMPVLFALPSSTAFPCA